ncbi:MAG: ammonium transporter [Candidatus Latescibacteria bacterium]|jgi:Amt family ammonium transporter|nr:ammonium transporter [Candidatus Latescibacterota bacterium]
MALLTLSILALPTAALAQEAPSLDSGDTAWMLASTALVLFMTIPGLLLFYGGLVRTKNVLSVLMQCLAITSLMTVLWVLYAYSLCFESGVLNKWVGGLGKICLKGVGVDAIRDGQTIPETVFMMFQLTFAIITPALIVGAFAERMKFSAMFWFVGIWLTLVYVPTCHWVWGGGWLGDMGALDFAGGTVVHVNAGFAGLTAAMVLGRRRGYLEIPMPPHNVTLTVVGACMLWVGWFGFNAGSQLAADGTAGMAMAVTQISAASAALTWMLVEWATRGKPSVLGMATGAVGGLVAITPASGFVGPMGALVIGAAAGVLCFLGATTLKNRCGYDDSLDVFGVHGIGGIVGAMLTGVFAASSLGGSGLERGIASQVGVQFVSVVATGIYSLVLTWIILKVIDSTIGLRVIQDEEIAGLDISLHDERGYNP